MIHCLDGVNYDANQICKGKDNQAQVIQSQHDIVPIAGEVILDANSVVIQLRRIVLFISREPEIGVDQVGDHGQNGMRSGCPFSL